MERDATTDLAEIEALEADLAQIEAELGALERAGSDVVPTESQTGAQTGDQTGPVADSAHQS